MEKVKVFKTTIHAGKVNDHLDHLDDIFLALVKVFSKFKVERSPEPRKVPRYFTG